MTRRYKVKDSRTGHPDERHYYRHMSKEEKEIISYRHRGGGVGHRKIKFMHDAIVRLHDR